MCKPWRMRWVLALVACCAVSLCITAAAEGDAETTTTESTPTSTLFEETTSDITESPEPTEPTKSPVEIAIAQVANVTSALLPALFYVAESAAPRAGGNVIVSPLAAAATLAMLLELEDGEGSTSGAAAAQELRRALRLPKTDTGAGAGPSLRLGFHALLGLSRAVETREDVAGAFASAVLRSGVSGELPSKAKESLQKYFWANVTKETRHIGSDSLELSVDAGILSHWKDLQLLPVYVVLSHRAAAPFQRGPDAGGEVSVPMVPLVGEYRLGAVKLDGFACKMVEVPLEAPGASLVLLLPPPELAVPDAALVAAAGQKLPELLALMPMIGAEVLLPQVAVVSRQLDLGPLLTLLGTKSTPPTLRLRQDAFLAASFSSLNAVNSVVADLGGSASGNPGKEERSRQGARFKRHARRRRQSLPRLVLDRPFLFFVLIDSQVILLAGRVRDPAQRPI